MPSILEGPKRNEWRQARAGDRDSGCAHATPSVSALALLVLGSLTACAGGPRCETSGCATDRALAAEARLRIDRHPALLVDQIDIHVLDGVVYLVGLVDTPLEEAEAVGASRSVPHIRGVEDELSVRGNR